MAVTKPKGRVRGLGYPAFFQYQAAEGWFELGDLDEAIKELGRMSARARARPEVLRLRWRILVRREQWNRCLALAKRLVRRFPEDPLSWVALAETFYLRRDVETAYRIASDMVAQFPQSWNLLYDAACYACLIGRFDQAKRFFQLALIVSGDEPSGQAAPAPERTRLRPRLTDPF
jgi:tetratricopeptide (TPR) repeat protein